MIVSLKSLLIGSTVYQFGAGFALIFMPRLLSNPLGVPEIRGEWDGGPAALALRPVAGCSYVSLGFLSLVPLIKPRERVTTSLLATLSLFHALICVPIALKNGFTIMQMPTFIAHALLAGGFLSYTLQSMEED